MVLSQNPQSGTQVKPGTVVRITVSEPGVTVPSVLGQTQAQATATLQGAGLQVNTVLGTPTSGGYGAGQVFATSPSAGTVVAAHTTITIDVVAGSTTTSPPPSTSPPVTTSPPPSTSPPATTSPGPSAGRARRPVPA